MAEEHVDTNSLLLLLGAGGLLYWITARKNQNPAAAGIVPAPAPPVPAAAYYPTPPPIVDLSTQPSALIVKWANWLTDLLTHYGYALQPSYVTPDSSTFQIVDTSGRGRNLVAINQAATDNALQFWWNYNAAHQYGTANPDTDPAAWARLQAIYAQLLQDFTPTFLQQ